MTRKPLNKLFRRAVQCRDQSVVDRLHDRGHPNKVSMKKKKKERKDGGRTRYLYPAWSRKITCGTPQIMIKRVSDQSEP